MNEREFENEERQDRRSAEVAAEPPTGPIADTQHQDSKAKDTRRPKRQVSEAKRNANRRNGAKSTGPKTKLGKARASRNASKHLIYARTSLLPKEDRERFLAIREQVFQDHRPESMIEVECCENIARSIWNQERLRSEIAVLERKAIIYAALQFNAVSDADRINVTADAAKEIWRDIAFLERNGYRGRDPGTLEHIAKLERISSIVDQLPLGVELDSILSASPFALQRERLSELEEKEFRKLHSLERDFWRARGERRTISGDLPGSEPSRGDKARPVAAAFLPPPDRGETTDARKQDWTQSLREMRAKFADDEAKLAKAAEVDSSRSLALEANKPPTEDGPAAPIDLAPERKDRGAEPISARATSPANSPAEKPAKKAKGKAHRANPRSAQAGPPKRPSERDACSSGDEKLQPASETATLPSLPPNLVKPRIRDIGNLLINQVQPNDIWLIFGHGSSANEDPVWHWVACNASGDRRFDATFERASVEDLIAELERAFRSFGKPRVLYIDISCADAKGPESLIEWANERDVCAEAWRQGEWSRAIAERLYQRVRQM